MTVQEEARWCIQQDGILAEIRKKIKRGAATYEDTAAYSARAGKMIGALFSRRLSEIPLEEREALCVELLHDQYIDINAAVDAAQRYLDEKLGIQIAPQHASFGSDRAHQIGSSTADPTVPEETRQRRARAATETATKAMHDDRMKTEAKFRSRAGLKCYITRKAASGCCKWCTKMAGRYEYGEEPEDIYRRHDNCDCTVTFEDGRKRQDVWGRRTKTWDEVDPVEIEAEGFSPTVLSEKEAAELQERLLQGLTNVAASGTISPRQPLRISMQFFAHRNSEDMPTIRLPKQEYAHVMSEIASHLTDSDKTSPVFVKRIGNYQYTVENHGFGNYRIIAKRKIRNG